MLITFLVIAVFLVVELSGVGNLGTFRFFVLLSPSTLPEVIVLAIGFVIVISKRSQYKNMSRYASIGIGGLLFTSLTTVILSFLTFSPFYLRNRRISYLVLLSVLRLHSWCFCQSFGSLCLWSQHHRIPRMKREEKRQMSRVDPNRPPARYQCETI